MSAMTKQEIEAVFERVRSWPQHRQKDVLNILLEMERQGKDLYQLSEEEKADLDEAEREIVRGEVASEEDVEAVLNRFRLR
jgi:hypothetical protein